MSIVTAGLKLMLSRVTASHATSISIAIETPADTGAITSHGTR